MRQPINQHPWSAFCVELIDISGVLALTNLSYDKIHHLVKGRGHSHPGFQWVWNFATKSSGERCLRFWRREVEDASTVSQLSMDDVLPRILPLGRQTFQAGQVKNLFSLNPTLLMRLRGQLGGRLRPGGSVFTRIGLERFLSARWVGAAIHRPAARRQSGCSAAAVCSRRNPETSLNVS